MDSDKNTPPASDSEPEKDETLESQSSSSEDQAPADALSRTPEDLEIEEAANKADTIVEDVVEKKGSKLKRFLKKINVYFLVFILLIIAAAVMTTVNYLNSQKVTPEPSIATQELTEDALKQLANTDASVGNTSQTLTIQGNAVIAGQTLMRGNLNVAGNFQTGGAIQGPSITISGSSNLGEAQINTLQVASNTTVQGTTTLRDLNVSGSTSFSGNIIASQITVTRLIMSGNAVLEIPNHISFTGASPTSVANQGVVGSGGSASINGSDATGTVNINTGNNPTAGCFIRLTFQQAYSNQPHVLISPIGAAAGQTQYYVDRNQSGFSVCASSAPPANQVLGFDYFITN